MRYLAFVLLIVAPLLYSCSETTQGHSAGLIAAEDIQEEVEESIDSLTDIEEEVEEVDPSTVYPYPNNSCVECQWYFCSDLGAVWQKQICIDYCASPPEVLYEGDCEEYLECNPEQYFLEQLECITEEGFPGKQDKVCNKGKIQYTDCVTDCEEETCNYEDDDCDGQIDEGQLNECNECGVVPAEMCNNYDDDCDGSTDEDLIQPCSTACGAGYELCSSGNWVSCTAPPELPEVCDGLDNDCDGQIDEGLECVCTIQDVGTLFPCQEDPLVCGQGFKTCECVTEDCTQLKMTECYAACYWIPPADPSQCDPLLGMVQPEKCNNFDDNCNQQIDEDLYSGCYTGPEGTLLVGICEPGIMTCDAGTWGNYNEDEDFIPYYCKDEVVPQEEICNGLDDDCDGITDWGEEMKDTDILFIVDWSGSMSDEIDAVMISLNQFAQEFSDEEVVKWSFLRGPVGIPPLYMNERLELQQDLVGFSDFLASLSSMDSSPQSMNTSFEMLLDAIYLSIKNITSLLPVPILNLDWVGMVPGLYPLDVKESVPPLQDFKISWRPAADRIIIIFSDEYPQSYLEPEITSSDVEQALSGTPQLKLYTFSRINHKIGWEKLAAAGNGKWYKLTNNPTEMYASLMEILDEICKGGASE